MATTTNYGWTTPDDTSLVKDGASAIRTLGSAIDTSLNTALGTKKAGLVLLNTTSFSAVASQSFNNVFSATYDNYRIVVNVSGNSNNDGDQYLRLRSSGTDLTASSYAYTSWIKRADTAADVSWTASPSTFIKLGAQDNVEKQGQAYLIDIISPFLTQWTKFTGTIVSQNDTSAFIGGSVGGLVFVTTSYDGFTLITQNGTFTGTVSVYGYNK